MKLLASIIFLLISNSLFSYQVIFSEDFEDSLYSVTLWKPANLFSFTKGASGNCIRVNSTSSASVVMISTAVPLNDCKGGMIVLAAKVKADDVSVPPNSWNGIKVMLKINFSDGTVDYPQLKLSGGSFDWIQQSILIPVPLNAVSGVLYLGLEKSTGTAYIDDIIIKLRRSAGDIPPARNKNIPIAKGHNFPALRGVMVSTSMSEKDATDLGTIWKVNLIRWQLGSTYFYQGLSTPDYDTQLEAELEKLDNVLEWCAKYNLNVIVDLHSLSRGCFGSTALQEKITAVWEKIAERYRYSRQIWAYDLANEPSFNEGDWVNDSLLLWEDLAEKITRRIRLIDSLKVIIIETQHGSPNSFTAFKPIDFSLSNIVYSIHMYEPVLFTHQTLISNPIKYDYPGYISGKLWDISALYNVMSAAQQFQEDYRVPILIGEFSAIRWAPNNSAYNYIRDCIEIFELLNWDWCYHAFREWQGWSAEHNENFNDVNPSPEPTERQKLLLSYFQKNITSADKNKDASPEKYRLGQNFPNPFNTETKVPYYIPEQGNITLTVYNILGQPVSLLSKGFRQPGDYIVTFTAEGLSGGIYLYRLQVNDFVETGKMMLMK